MGPDRETEPHASGRVLPSMAVLQHERFVLWVLVRYLPFLLGVVMVALFGASVAHDREDLAHLSWGAGGEFLGTYADLGRALILPLFAGSALFRRGQRRVLRILEVSKERILAEDETGRGVEIPRDAVRSAFAYARGDGTETVVLELVRGLFRFGLPGDRLSLTVEPERAREIVGHFSGDRTEVFLSTRSPRTGGVIAALSLVLGTIAGVLVYRYLHDVAKSLPRASYYLPVVPDAQRGWLGGLTITAMGLAHATISWFARPPVIVLGDDALEIRGARIRTIPYARIAAIEVTRFRLWIELDDETRIERFCLAADRERLEGLAASVRGRVAALRGDRPIPAGLERGDASVDRWRRAIEARAAAPRYRVGALDPDMLVACVTAASLPRDVRIGAALALSAKKDPAERALLRAAVDDVSPPSLRALVEELAEGEAADATILDALQHRRRTR